MNKLENKDFNFKEFKKELSDSDLLGLEYLENYIPKDLKDLYFEVLSYNEIYGNGWTIEDLFKMGKKDSYWTDRAKAFISKHNVSKKNYANYTKYFEEYTIKRDLLFKELGFDIEKLYS